MTASWDQARFLAGLGPMQPMSAQFLRAFLTSLEHHLDILVHARMPEDVALMKRSAHSIKGSASQIFCAELSRIAAEIEHASDDGLMSEAVSKLCLQAKIEAAAVLLFIEHQRSE
jgi:HPt (histidine-containing phosphotransfer) domain-containing protein